LLLCLCFIASTVQAQAPTTPAQVEQVIKQQPNNYDLRLQAASFYMRGGQYAAAIPHLQAATGLRPREVFAWIGLGDAQALAGKLKDARTAYERALFIAPKEPLVYRGLGELYLHEKQFEKAKQTFLKGLNVNPASLELLLSLGNLLVMMDDAPLAVKYLKKAVELAPNDAEAHYLLGEAYERNRHLNAALKENLIALRLNPSLTEAYGRVGLYNIKLTRYKEARTYLQKAIELNPHESHYYWAMGDAYFFDVTEPKRYDKAIELYQKALSLNPNNTNALFSIGMALSRRGRKEDLRRAIPYLERFAQIIPEGPEEIQPYYLLSEAYRRLGDQKQAQKYRELFQQSKSRRKVRLARVFTTKSFLDTAEAHVRLGNRYLKEGNVQMALKEFQFALERNPNLPAAKEGLKKAQERLKKKQ
jgi:tetratricopeptide (TPR) repeat protein